MKKLVLGLMGMCALGLVAQEGVFVHTGTVANGGPLDNVDEVTFSSDTLMNFATANSVYGFSAAKIDSVTFEECGSVVDIVYNGTTATVVNPFAFEGVMVECDGADVVVHSTMEKEFSYRLSGTATDGSFKIYAPYKFQLELNNLNLTNKDGAAINSQCKKKMTLVLPEGTSSSLADGSKYVTVDGEDMKGCLFSEGQIEVNGTGSLTVVGNKKHAICTDDEFQMKGGNITVTSAKSDGVHSKDKFTMNDGTLTITADGDGIDGDVGKVDIKGGTIKINVATDTQKGIKCDDIMRIRGGKIEINTSGGVVVTDGDPSYCTGMKCDSTINIEDGEITIISTGAAGKGISGNYDINITGGTINITTSGNGSTYTTASNTTDSYSATCIKADGAMNIMGGNITVSSSGSAGKGINADGRMTIGDGTAEPIINASTSGAKFYVTGNYGGWGDNGDYANPKAIKCGSTLVINSGHIVAKTQKDGGEGIESKDSLIINGGIIEAETYDDGLNAKNAIVINGGKIYSNASGNDGIDSNGTITVTGGLVISSGTNSPEEGFDCDQNTFKITGGILIGTGGATSMPTSSVCTQKVLLYGGSGTKDQYIHIQNAVGDDILTYKLPKTLNQMTLLFSSPKLENATYTIYKGGSVTGGEEFHGYVTDGTYSGGTSSSTFTASSTVTTVGNVSTGPGGGGGGGRPGWGAPTK